MASFVRTGITGTSGGRVCGGHWFKVLHLSPPCTHGQGSGLGAEEASHPQLRKQTVLRFSFAARSANPDWGTDKKGSRYETGPSGGRALGTFDSSGTEVDFMW